MTDRPDQGPDATDDDGSGATEYAEDDYDPAAGRRVGPPVGDRKSVV